MVKIIKPQRASQAQMSYSDTDGLTHLAKVIEDFETVRRSWDAQLIDLAMAAAEKIVRHEVARDPQVIRRTLDALKNRVPAATEICLKVNPADQSEVQTFIEQSERLVWRRAEVVTDAEVERGGCVVSTNLGDVDARIQVQLSALVDCLKKQSR